MEMKLENKSIMVATPCYGGITTAFYTKSMIQLSSICESKGIKLYYYSLTSESLITRARNYCADEFMRSPATHLVFIDADIEFNPYDVLMLVSLCEGDKDVVCGPYPLKEIAWEKVKYAVDKGHADIDARNLENLSVDYVFNIDQDIKEFKLAEPLKVSEAGTGFMCINRSVFQRLGNAHPEWKYIPDHVKSANFGEDKEIYCYFNAEIDPVSRRYLSEDYKFCRDIAKLGMNIYICPWMKLNHIGTYKFIGDLENIAKAGLSYGVMKGLN
jgi:hypothetical protein